MIILGSSSRAAAGRELAAAGGVGRTKRGAGTGRSWKRRGAKWGKPRFGNKLKFYKVNLSKPKFYKIKPKFYKNKATATAQRLRRPRGTAPCPGW